MQTSTPSSIVWFDEQADGADLVELFGGKGANLAFLAQHGKNVPPGFTVRTDTGYDAHVAGIRDDIAAIVDKADLNDPAQLKLATAQIRQMITDTPLDKQVQADLEDGYDQLVAMGFEWTAVRSSSTGEDGEDAAAAGLQDTYLNIRGKEAVVQHVVKCWASLWTERATAYRENRGMNHLDTSIAVLVMAMVQSDQSGIMYSIHRMTFNPDQVFISGGLGLGERFVSGGEDSTGDVIYASRAAALAGDPCIVKYRSTPQHHTTVRSDTGLGNVDIDVPPDKVEAHKFTDDQIAELTREADNIEQLYDGVPQDIEFGYLWLRDNDDNIIPGSTPELFILQSRPMTVTGTYVEEAPLPNEPAPVIATGFEASNGIVCGPVKVLLSPDENHLINPGDVLAAETTSPEYMDGMRRALAFATNEGGPACHAAVTGAELEVPTVVGAVGLTDVILRLQAERGIDQLDPDGEQLWITVDGTHGVVYLGEAKEMLAWWVEHKKRMDAADAEAAKLETKIKVRATVGLPEKAERAITLGAKGFGLVRGEEFLIHDGHHPYWYYQQGEAGVRQYIEKRKAFMRPFLDAAGDELVVFRGPDMKPHELGTLKGAPPKSAGRVTGSIVGRRGGWFYWAGYPELFMMELQVFKELVEEGYKLCLMLPFVRTVKDLVEVSKLIDKAGLVRGDNFQVWMMAEVPSNVWGLPRFLDTGLVDGVSIGSNDLTQLMLGVDRDDEVLAQEYTVRDPAVLEAIEVIVTTCVAYGVPCSFCGNAWDLAEKLAQWGVNSISVTPPRLGTTIRTVHAVEQRA